MRAVLFMVCSVLTLTGCSDGSGPGPDPCEGRQCGEAGGKDCGTCPGATEVCDEAGMCVDLCAGRECGEVEGMGCGTCTGATEVCDEAGMCVDLCAERECGEPASGISRGQCAQPEICGLPGRCFVPGGCPVAMVEVGLTGVCIDAYEVTCPQMAAFLNEHGNECRIEGFYDLNDRYICAAEGVGEEFGLYESDGQWQVKLGYEEHPVVAITYVGARLACEHWGKQLCKREEWARACEGPDSNVYPYGNSYEPLTCNACRETEEYPECPPDPQLPEPVGSFPGCEGGYAGLFDMSGNVHEWVAGTVPFEYGVLYTPAGGSAGMTSRVDCRSSFDGGGGSPDPYSKFTRTGFRCCYYLD